MFRILIILSSLALLMSCSEDSPTQQTSNPPNADTLTTVRLIHVAADPALQSIDIYFNGVKNSAGNDLAFRSASDYFTITADTGIVVTIASATSANAGDGVIRTLNIGELKANTDNVLIISGVADSSRFVNPLPLFRDIRVNVAVFKNFSRQSLDPVKTEVFLFHGLTDTPEIDLLLDGEKTPSINDINYRGHNAPPLEISADLHTIALTPYNANGLNYISADLDASNLAGQKVFLIATGFLEVAGNEAGPPLRFLLVPNQGSASELEFDLDNVSEIYFNRHIQPILNENCLSCHNSSTAESGLNLDNWNDLIRGSDFGEALIPYDTTRSRMLRMMKELIGGPHPLEQGAELPSKKEINFLTRWISEGAKNDAGEVPYENSQHRLYVCAQNEATVYVIDTQANVVMRTIDLAQYGYLISSKPHQVAVEADGSAWFLTLIGGNRIMKFDAENNLLAQSEIYDIPALMALHPTKPVLYVSRFMDFNNPISAIIGLKSSTLSPLGGTNDGEIFLPFAIPHAIAASHDGKYVYTASLSQSQLMVINTTSNQMEDFHSLGPNQGPLQMVVSPDDSELYISGQLSDQVLVVNVADSSNRFVSDSVAVGNQPWHPALTSDGSTLYVGNFGSQTLSVVDVASRTVTATISGNGFSQPHGTVVSNGGRVYVSNRNTGGFYTARNNFDEEAMVGTVVIVNAATNQIEKVLEVGPMATGMAIYEQ